MNRPVKLMLVFINEADSWHDRPLYEALVRRLRQLEVSGATVQKGLMGFGSHLRVHHKGLFGIGDDLPIIVSAVDSDEKLRAIAPEIRQMVRGGLVLLLDAELVAPVDSGEGGEGIV